MKKFLSSKMKKFPIIAVLLMFLFLTCFTITPAQAGLLGKSNNNVISHAIWTGVTNFIQDLGEKIKNNINEAKITETTVIITTVKPKVTEPTKTEEIINTFNPDGTLTVKPEDTNPVIYHPKLNEIEEIINTFDPDSTLTVDTTETDEEPGIDPVINARVTLSESCDFNVDGSFNFWDILTIRLTAGIFGVPAEGNESMDLDGDNFITQADANLARGILSFNLLPKSLKVLTLTNLTPENAVMLIITQDSTEEIVELISSLSPDVAAIILTSMALEFGSEPTADLISLLDTETIVSIFDETDSLTSGKLFSELDESTQLTICVMLFDQGKLDVALALVENLENDAFAYFMVETLSLDSLEGYTGTGPGELILSLTVNMTDGELASLLSSIEHLSPPQAANFLQKFEPAKMQNIIIAAFNDETIDNSVIKSTLNNFLISDLATFITSLDPAIKIQAYNILDKSKRAKLIYALLGSTDGIVAINNIFSNLGKTEKGNELINLFDQGYTEGFNTIVNQSSDPIDLLITIGTTLKRSDIVIDSFNGLSSANKEAFLMTLVSKNSILLASILFKSLDIDEQRSVCNIALTNENVADLATLLQTIDPVNILIGMDPAKIATIVINFTDIKMTNLFASLVKKEKVTLVRDVIALLPLARGANAIADLSVGDTYNAQVAAYVLMTFSDLGKRVAFLEKMVNLNRADAVVAILNTANFAVPADAAAVALMAKNMSSPLIATVLNDDRLSVYDCSKIFLNMGNAKRDSILDNMNSQKAETIKVYMGIA